MKIAAIQISNDVKISTNAEDILHLISQAKDLGADLIAFPECALTGFSAKVKEIPTDAILSGLKKIHEASIRLDIGVLIPTVQAARRPLSLSLLRARPFMQLNLESEAWMLPPWTFPLRWRLMAYRSLKR